MTPKERRTSLAQDRSLEKIWKTILFLSFLEPFISLVFFWLFYTFFGSRFSLPVIIIILLLILVAEVIMFIGVYNLTRWVLIYFYVSVAAALYLVIKKPEQLLSLFIAIGWLVGYYRVLAAVKNAPPTTQPTTPAPPMQDS